MKTLILLLVSMLFMPGCMMSGEFTETTTNLETNETVTRTLKYFRWGNQELSGVELIMEDGSAISIESQKSDMAQALKIIEKLTSLPGL